MKGFHPNFSIFTALIALSACVAAGCQHPSGGMSNPFLAPNRVPPPATRALLPGQAQPYYPGDPLPPMQSGTAPAEEANAVAAEGTNMPSADTDLAWTSPSGAPAMGPAPEKTSIAFSQEPTIAIPADGGSLRFAQTPPREPELFRPDAAFAIDAGQRTPGALSPPNVEGVQPASYTALGEGTTTSTADNPWRTPSKIPHPGNPTGMALGQALTPIAVAASSNMDVRLRAVASPPLEGPSGIPRVRMPGTPASPPTVGSSDGFRPRSSMR